ncbi:glucan-binding YG repeat protein [Bacillus sp. SLBN-46]|uniref:metallophosphoesterase n=1 Tax=Bacillus sp. SLBN-46 TaxID=3042283 RepID=UPI00285DC107|nr:metallophosphoesterase [Bacillus sp. SLBN-46]MDR6120891.1 glucan-binding YG repeat protein [Bacillus sp. SLBN-46]
MIKKLAAAWIGFIALALFQIPAEANELTPSNSTPNLQIPIMSDVHINESIENRQMRFQTALQEFKSLAPNYQALAIVGDLTDQGLDRQYEKFNQILSQYANQDAERVLVMGNHEFYEGIYWPKPYFTDEMFIDRFITNTGMPGLYYDKWIEGVNSKKYHFIVLGSEESKVTNPNNHDDAVLSDEQYQWLENTLSVETDPKKPIFVFLHQPIDDTVYGSEEWGGNLRDGRLKGILQKYPQAILFTGHLHYLLNHPRSVYQDGFTMADTGSLAYTLYENGNAPAEFSQGLLVNVYDNKVEIKAREFSNHTWINQTTIKLPYTKTVDDTEFPYFNHSDTGSVNKVTATTATVSWPAAKDNTQVDKYIIKLNGEAVQTQYSKFWEDQSDQVYTTTITNLAGNTEYTLEVSAVDAWNNVSLNPLKISLKTDKYNGWVKEGNNTYYYNYQTGQKVTGWLKVQDKWYYFNPVGVMQKGWINDLNKWYYLNDSGAMVTGWLTEKGIEYYLNNDGSLKTGWLCLQNKWYYLSSSGAKQVGWIRDVGYWYYLDQTGVMKIGWVLDKENWYYLKSSGVMQVGWLFFNGSWYYLDTNGLMKTGWVYIGNKWYYLYDDGKLAVNTQIGTYKLGKDGAWIH